jgi:ATP-dependent RNA helicase DeaD
VRAGRTGTAISIIGPKDIGNLYLLRLTYKIRPIEKQLPSAGEVKTRAEMDLLQLFVEAFSSKPVHPDDLSLARRLLTHDDAERIVAGLLRDHLGARGGDVVAAAGEKRRARNPEPQPVAQAAAAPEPAREAPRRRPEPQRGRERGERADRSDRSDRDPRRSAATSPTGWRPPAEADDERPILKADAPPRESASALPGFTVDEPQVASSGEAPGFLELFVNIGRREGVRTSDLEQLLTGKGITQADMGGIRIRDRMTFISVKKEALERVTAALAGQVIGGRNVVAELARGRS